MQILNQFQKNWQKLQADANRDPMLKRVLDYAICWAELMENLLARGAKLEDIAESSSFQASSIHQMSGAGHTQAAAMLASCWAYAPEFVPWYNRHNR